MTNPLARVAMKNLSDFKPVAKSNTTNRINNTYNNSKVEECEETLIKKLIRGDLKAEGVTGEQVYTLEELATKLKNNY